MHIAKLRPSHRLNSANHVRDRNFSREIIQCSDTWLSMLRRRADRHLIKHAGGAACGIFYTARGRVSSEQRGGPSEEDKRLSSLSRKTRPSRPSGIAKIPRARFVILYTTAGTLVSKEWRTQEALSEIPTLHLPTYHLSLSLRTCAHIIRLFA